jgi:hypothetical protein
MLAGAGVGLALAAIWLDPLEHGGGSYWSDHSTGIFLLVTGIASALLLLAGLVRGRAEVVGAGALVAAVPWGFYLFLPALYAFDRLGSVGLGGWLGAASGLLIGLGATPAPELAARGAGREPESTPLLAGRLLAGAGFVVVALSLWFTSIRSGPFVSLSYWDSNGRHSLGIFMLCVCGGGLLLAGAAAVTRGLLAEWLALGLALVLLGVTVWYPVALAPSQLDAIRPVGWLAVAGSLLAAAASAATLALESRAAPPALPPDGEPTPPLGTGARPAAD